MEKRLNDAAIRNDIVALSQLVEEDPYLLDRIYLNFDEKNALHMSAMLGHKEFFQALLQINSSSHYQYHMCLVRDRNGRNPLHLAAIHGKLNILNLVRDHDGLIQAAQDKADEGGNILHLCVKYNQLDALNFLLRIFADPEFLSAKNEDGMTILHLALYYKDNEGRREIILYLINNIPQIINIKNANGKTALDLCHEKVGIPDQQFQQIVDSILKSGGKSGYVTAAGENEPSDDEEDEVILKLVEKSKDTIMIVASIIATMASQAMVNPPGGIRQDDSSEGPSFLRGGKCVKKQTDPGNFVKGLNIVCNSIALVSSLIVILMLLVRVRRTVRRPRWKLNVFITVICFLLTVIFNAYPIALVIRVLESARWHLVIPSLMIVIVLTVVGISAIWIFRYAFRLENLGFLSSGVNYMKIFCGQPIN